MAAGILRQLARNAGWEVGVQTAGLWAQEGYLVAKHAVEAMTEIGIDISGDYPKNVSSTLVEWADAIVTLDSRYADELEERFPQASSKMLPSRRGIPDPVGGDLDRYRQCRDTLLQEIKGLVRHFSERS